MNQADRRTPRSGSALTGSAAVLDRIVRWYAASVYGRIEGLGRIPYYCDPERVGAFAVTPAALREGGDDALFRVVVSLAMFQSRRDVDIMAIQREMPRRAATAIASAPRLSLLIGRSRCEHLVEPERFDAACDVRRDFAGDRTTCGYRPRTACHVKEATTAIGRMSDMGMQATSTWLHLRDAGGATALLDRVVAASPSPQAAADAMVVKLAKIHRIGVKLATMIVSALATPVLAPGLTPWWPRLDGNHLVVVDANVARTIDILRRRGPRTYAAYSAWFRRHAAAVDLRQHRRAWPQTSPRIVQQAVYWFRSRSNREAAGLACRSRCDESVRNVCPFCSRLGRRGDP